jgi:hypothetical protein
MPHICFYNAETITEEHVASSRQIEDPLATSQIFDHLLEGDETVRFDSSISGYFYLPVTSNAADVMGKDPDHSRILREISSLMLDSYQRLHETCRRSLLLSGKSNDFVDDMGRRMAEGEQHLLPWDASSNTSGTEIQSGKFKYAIKCGYLCARRQDRITASPPIPLHPIPGIWLTKWDKYWVCNQ